MADVTYELQCPGENGPQAIVLTKEEDITKTILNLVVQNKASMDTEFVVVKVIREPAKKIKLGIQESTSLEESLPENNPPPPVYHKRKRRTQAEIQEARRLEEEAKAAKKEAKAIAAEPPVQAVAADEKRPTVMLEKAIRQEELREAKANAPVVGLEGLEAAIDENEAGDSLDLLRNM